eukprot:sb/3462261/
MIWHILELYRDSPPLQDLAGSRIFPAILRVYKGSQDKLYLSQLAAMCLPIATCNGVSDLSPKDRKEVVKTLVKQIDMTSHGRGNCLSFMGAHILRNLFCCLGNVITQEFTSISIRWLIPWIADKDPVIRSTALSLYFTTPEIPLSTESAVVLAVSAFTDSTEVWTVRQQALSFIARVIRCASRDSQDQTLALTVLALKRMNLYESCATFAVELGSVVNQKEQNVSNSQMITSYFEEAGEGTWGTGYTGLFYILDSILELSLTLVECGVVVLKNHVKLVTPLTGIFTADTLTSLDVETQEIFVSCWVRLLHLADVDCCGPHLVEQVVRVVEMEGGSCHVTYLQQHCLAFLREQGEEEGDLWRRILPTLARLISHPELQGEVLLLLNSALRGNSSALRAQLKDGSDDLCDNLLEVVGGFKITTLTPGDMLVFSVVGLLCGGVKRARERALKAGLVEICHEYLILLVQHLDAMRLAGSGNKENTGAINNTKRKGGKGRAPLASDVKLGDLLKTLSATLYCLCSLVSDCPEAALRLTDLDILALLSKGWSHYSANIVVLNYLVKLLSLTVQASPGTAKLLLSQKTLLAKVQELALASTRFTKHPVTPLRDVLFDFMCVLSSNQDAVCHIWKSGFMGDFPKMEKQKTEPEKLVHWLRLVIHGTYTGYGQRMALTIPNILDIILESCQKSSILMLVRNLVFNSKCHPKLLTHSSILQFVMECIDDSKPKQTLLALQALYYFARLSNKAKSILKNQGCGNVLVRYDFTTKDKDIGELRGLSDSLLEMFC